MIASLRPSSPDNRPESVEDQFLAILPMIRRQASLAFRHAGAEARDELMAETVANAYCAFVRLARRGKLASVYATPLAQFAIRQVRGGRRVGGRLKLHDILSPQARRHYGITIERIDRRDPQDGVWGEMLVEDRKAGPAQTAAARLDLTAWLRTLSKRNRQIAKALSVGEPTGTVARQYGLSAGRVSQLRVWLREHWEQFQGDGQLAGCVA
jgi:hypothetical protein